MTLFFCFPQENSFNSFDRMPVLVAVVSRPASLYVHPPNLDLDLENSCRDVTRDV